MSAGYGMCDGCGAALTDGEMFRGDLCDDCRRDPFLDDRDDGVGDFRDVALDEKLFPEGGHE